MSRVPICNPIPRVDMSKKSPPSKKHSRNEKKMPSPHIVLVCRRAHLRRFWHVGGHSCVILACRRAQLRRFGMTTGTGVILAC